MTQPQLPALRSKPLQNPLQMSTDEHAVHKRNTVLKSGEPMLVIGLCFELTRLFRWAGIWGRNSPGHFVEKRDRGLPHFK
jgi:hypothetical protein